MAENNRALANVTITLDPDTAAKARVKAAEAGMSLSRYIGDVLRAQLGQDDEYWAAYRRWKARKPWNLKGPPERYPTRDELYDRPVLRRR